MEQTETKKIYASVYEVVDRAKEIVATGEQVNRDELDLLKNVFYKLGLPDANEFMSVESEFKEVMSNIRAQRAETQQQLDVERKANLERKLAIIEKVKDMATSPDEANKSYSDFKALQAEWKTIGSVPPENATEIWRQYQHLTEQFYDLLKLNFEARDYDFKKNLEVKNNLCEQAEALVGSEDVVSAFKQLQLLHEQYRECGPVAKELREEIWNRFKTASTAINKAHQSHFESLRAQEEENLEKKTALCEKAEALVGQLAEGVNWSKMSEEMLALQAEWKTIGFAPKKMNQKIFDRFRASCDAFFNAKSTFFKEQRAGFNEGIARRKAIIEEAKNEPTAEKLKALQAEWKELGNVPHKIGTALWAEVRAECDKVFEARREEAEARKAQREARKAKFEARAQRAEARNQKAEVEVEDNESMEDKLAKLKELWNFQNKK